MSLLVGRKYRWTTTGTEFEVMNYDTQAHMYKVKSLSPWSEWDSSPEFLNYSAEFIKRNEAYIVEVPYLTLSNLCECGSASIGHPGHASYCPLRTN